MVIAAILFAALPQTAVELKLKLREDEVVRFRNVFNVVTYSPDKIDERVQNSLMSFTFGAEKDGKIAVKAVVEEYEGMDAGSNGAGPAMKQVNLSFDLDKKGGAGPVKHTTSNPAFEPVGALLSKTLAGMNSIGFLGLTMPEKTVSVGETWSLKVEASDFLAPALAPGGDMFQVDGTYDVLFTLVDVTNVNNKRHARISVDVKGKSELAINSPEITIAGTLTVTSTSSVLLDLETGLISSAKTDTTANLDVGEAEAQIVMWNLLYRKV